MGMFDEIDYKTTCPVCHSKIDEFQSKDADCILKTLDPQDVDTFYSNCDTCECRVEYRRVNNRSFERVVSRKDKVLREHTKIVNFKKRNKK
jgi:hypothetical protein